MPPAFAGSLRPTPGPHRVSKPIHLEARDQSGAKMFSPTAARNKGPIADALVPHLPKSAQILEVGSGTGEHALHITTQRHDLIWRPTDPDATSRASINAHATDSPATILPALSLDVTDPTAWAILPSYDAIFTANMIHIAPRAATHGLALGASAHIRQGGHLFIYGPFLKGDASTEGNLNFDRTLKSRNSDWGVWEITDVKALFAKHALVFRKALALPANNDLLIFERI